MNPIPLSILIPTYNSSQDLSELLPVLRWANELVVIDSFSTDDTVKLAQTHGAHVIQHEYINSAQQKNLAIPQCAHDWILLVDTDERLSTELQTEIQELLRTNISADVDAFRIARRTIFLGKWLKLRTLWPDYQTRLFRKAVGRYANKEVHADVVVPGKVLILQQPLDHYSTPTLSKPIGYLDRYSSYKAAEFEKQGRHFRWLDILIRPLGAFLYCYIVCLGFTAGLRGLFWAFHTMAFSFFSYAKLWEKEWQAKRRH